MFAGFLDSSSKIVGATALLDGVRGRHQLREKGFRVATFLHSHEIDARTLGRVHRADAVVAPMQHVGEHERVADVTPVIRGYRIERILATRYEEFAYGSSDFLEKSCTRTR